MNPVQPLHIDVAFPAGNHQANWIALLGAQSLAILRVGDQDVVEGFLNRNAARHQAGVRALRDDPLGFGLENRRVQQRGERNARPLGATEQARAQLRSRLRIPGLLGAAIAGALDEMDTRNRTEAPQIVHREDQRFFDQSVNQNFVLGWIDVRYSGVMAFEVKRRRCNHAVQILKRRASRTGAWRNRFSNIANGFFVRRAFAIRAQRLADFARDAFVARAQPHQRNAQG